MSVGATNVISQPHLFKAAATDASNVPTEDDLMFDNNTMLSEAIYEMSDHGDLDVNDIMVLAAHAQRHQGVDPDHLSKIWKISDLESK